MKQLLQSLKSGRTEVVDVPCPVAAAGGLLVRTSRTLVSAGTERMLVQFGKAGLLAKARQQPGKVQMVVDKVRTDGLLPTIEAVRSKLDQPLALGYCNVGTVVDVGRNVHDLAIGDRVASNGHHAEMVAVPTNLSARIPDEVADDEAAFTVVGAIALQGIRLAAPTLGETVVVTGLGLIGLLAVQLLRAQGCRVLGLDYDSARLALARQFGAETVDLGAAADPIPIADAFTKGRGVDAVLITASTDSDEPVRQAAAMCRKRGRIVLVGVAGLRLNRADFYEKELSFQVSCSYGPGRYDADYEERGVDYPIGFVRWTEQRNFEAVLDMMASGRIDVKPLISHRFPIDEIGKAYELISGKESSLGVLLEYSAEAADLADLKLRTVEMSPRIPRPGRLPIGFIGAGNYAIAGLIPAFRDSGADLDTIASRGGIAATYAARKFQFARVTTDLDSLFSDSNIAAVVIATRHDSHAELVCRALDAQKHVLVEKPFALTGEELDEIEAARSRAIARGFTPVIAVGFNRRFAPHTLKMKALLTGAPGPKAFIMTVNAGAIPGDHWLHDPQAGGGRVLGEGCHFVDLLRFLSSSPIVEIRSTFMGTALHDSAMIQMAFADGSIGTIHYLANGPRGFPKERLEVFASGRYLCLENFRTLKGTNWPGFSRMKLMRQNKGQARLAADFVAAIRDAAPEPMDFDELMEVSRAAIQAGGTAGAFELREQD